MNNLHIILLFIVALCPIYGAAHARYSDTFYEPLTRMTIEEIADLGFKSESPDSAMAYYTVAIKKFETSGEKKDLPSYAYVLNLAGYTSLFHLDNYKDAYGYLRQAETVAEECNDSIMLSLITLNLANVAVGISDLQEAYKYYKDSMDYSLSLKDWGTYISAYLGYITQKGLEDGIEHVIPEVNRFLSLDSIPPVPLREFSKYLNQGIIHLSQKEYDKGEECFTLALQNIDTQLTPERYTIMPILFNAEAYRLKGDIEGKINYLETSIGDATPECQLAIYKTLSETYHTQGNERMADKYMLMYYEGASKLGIPTRNADVTAAKATFDRMLLQKDMDILAEKNRTAQTIITISVAWGVILLIVLIILWRVNRSLVRSKKDLFKKNLELAGGMGTVIQDNAEQPSDDTPITECTPEEPDAKAKSGKEPLTKLWEHIRETMETTDEKFKQDFSIAQLAALVGEHPRKVSSAINTCLGKNFAAWLLELRINEARRRLADTENYGKFTISSIAEGLGFKSRTHFADVFKKLTGLSASEYQKIAKESK